MGIESEIENIKERLIILEHNEKAIMLRIKNLESNR